MTNDFKTPLGVLHDLNKPSYGLLASIATRLDHSFALQLPGESKLQHQHRQFALLCDARRCLDEIAGRGFYHRERDEEYERLILPEVMARFMQYKGV